MKIRSLLGAGMLSCWCLLCSQVASALPTVFNFASTVTYTDGSMSGVGVGTTFSGSFSYDPATSGSNHGAVSYYLLGPATSLSADIGGHSLITGGLSVGVTNNFGANVEDVLEIYGDPLDIDGISFSDGYMTLVLYSYPGNIDALASFDLPSFIDVGAFDGNYGVIARDHGSNGTMLAFTIDSITGGRIPSHNVPEPNTVASMLLGLASFGAVLRWQKRK